MPRRRKGRGRVFSVRQSRPKDKQIFCFNQVILGVTQTNYVCYTISFPGTVAGLLWDFRCGFGTVTPQIFYWCVQICRQNINIPVINTAGNGASFITPEQNVMAFGAMTTGVVSAGNDHDMSQGRTKSMRKLMGGDRLILSVAGLAAGTNGSFLGMLQWFILS